MSKSEDKKVADTVKSKTLDGKWHALRALRRAKGFCQFCIEKWSRGHKCPSAISCFVEGVLFVPNQR